MITKDTREKLLGIISKKMIPEYKSLDEEKESLKKAFINYLEKEYLTEEDRKLISKYPGHIRKTTNVPILYYYRYSEKEITLEYFKGDYAPDKSLTITFDKSIPIITDTIYSLKNNKKAWKKIGPCFNRYLNIRNSYVRKFNKAYDFLVHKNTTLSLIKKEFPELYNLYKSC